MSRLTVIGPNLRDQSKGSFHVHDAGCMDIKRNPNYRNAGKYTANWDSLEDVVTAIYEEIMWENDEDWPSCANDFHVHQGVTLPSIWTGVKC